MVLVSQSHTFGGGKPRKKIYCHTLYTNSTKTALKDLFPEEPLRQEVLHHQLGEGSGNGKTKETTLQFVFQGKSLRKFL